MRSKTSEDVPATPALAGLDMADWIHLAAAPLFAVMAPMTALMGGTPAVICAADAGWPAGGMVPMYALMSIVHVAPWLKLVSARGR